MCIRDSLAAECGKLVSKETKVDIIVTPLVTILIGCIASVFLAPWVGLAASSLGNLIMWATELQPFFMGIIISVVVGIALTLSLIHILGKGGRKFARKKNLPFCTCFFAGHVLKYILALKHREC